MTKPTTKSARLAILDQLSKTVEGRLKGAGPDGLTVHEVAHGLVFSASTVRERLAALEQTGRAFRMRHTQPGRTAIFYTWHSSQPDIVEHSGLHQATVRNYPPIDRRDWAVEALFGPAHKEVA